MSYSDSNHPHQSIPLQDLNRPPDDNDTLAPQDHRRTLSDRGRNLLRQTGALATGSHYRDSQYAPIAESSPSPTRHASRPQLNTNIDSQHGGIRHVEEPDPGSPIDAGAFQAAIGFGMDMNFQGETSPPLTPPIPTPASSAHSYGQYDHYPYQDRTTSEDQGYFSQPIYDDTARLTDARHLQPISGARASLSPQHSHDRSSFQSVRFLSPGSTSSRHGDNLDAAEAASGNLRDSRGRARSLSPGLTPSPLDRAGTIMRNISQRVVNVSNDSQVAERTLHRKSSAQSRLHGPPSFPALPEYATDGPASPSPSTRSEKPPSPVFQTRKLSAQWPRPPPFKGKSLGIFSRESKLRMRLSDVLIHPATEPILLLLIVIQTVLLAVDASSKAKYEPGISKNIREYSAIDYALLGLFIIYSIEVVIRIIVSGFIINPVEYSTINRQVSLREAVMMKANRLFGGPERQSSTRRSATNVTSAEPQQPSVLRTFTTAQMHVDIGPGDYREQQRARLAHRAYLRHSFNRTDFLAVVSFWISFILGVIGIENTRVILVFDMLSCLRIIRLLNLTSGTAVSIAPTPKPQ